MFADFSVLQFLIYAAGIGFAAAIIYTNIQRTALSKFVLFLIDNNCINAECSRSLDDMSLKGIEKTLVRSAVKSQYGFKRCVSQTSKPTESQSKNLEVFFENKDCTKYFLKDCNIDELRKKYSYKTMSSKLVVLFIIALFTVVIVCSYLTELIIDNVTTPKLDNNEKNEIEQSEMQEQTDNQNNNEVTNSEPSDEIITESETDGPRIPI